MKVGEPLGAARWCWASTICNLGKANTQISMVFVEGRAEGRREVACEHCSWAACSCRSWNLPKSTEVDLSRQQRCHRELPDAAASPCSGHRQSCESPRPCSVSVRGAAAWTLLLRGKFPRQQLPCFLTGRLMEQGRGKGQSAEYGFIGLGASTHSVSHRHRFPRADVEPGALPAQAPGPAPRLGAHRARSPHAEPAGCSCCKIKTNLD